MHLQAGSYYGLWGTLLFLYGIPIGGVIDALGKIVALHLTMIARSTGTRVTQVPS